MANPSLDETPPVPPAQPSIDDCCRSGCDPCVFDLYEQAVERYRVALREWKKRRAVTRENDNGGN